MPGGGAHGVGGELAGLDEAADVAADEVDGDDALVEELRGELRDEVAHRVGLRQVRRVQRLPYHLHTPPRP